MQYIAITHCGYVREQNEDAYYTPSCGGVENLAIVADGMGGHQAGEVASSMAVDSVVSAFSCFDGPEDTPLSEKIFQTMSEANREVYEAMIANQAYFGMGTTMTMAVVKEEQICLGHVGDSRAYLFHAGELRQITRDHTLVQQLIDIGALAPEQRRHHPKSNVITRALGTSRFVDIDLYNESWYQGDILLLCSDGLSGAVDDKEIIDILAKLPGQDAAQALVDLALKRGGRDNITVLLVLHGGDEK